jgi:hypothetical protein
MIVIDGSAPVIAVVDTTERGELARCRTRRPGNARWRVRNGMAPTSCPAVPLRAFDLVETRIGQVADDNAVVVLAPGLL